MTKTAFENYRLRMVRVLTHIDEHAGSALTLESLAEVAAFSKFHFHRQFSALFGVSVHHYVHLVRMKRAADRLAYRQSDKVTDIGLDAGFEAPEAFSRSFKLLLGVSPSAFRKKPDWRAWQKAFSPFHQIRSKHVKSHFTADQVKIVTIPTIPMAYMEHLGDPSLVGSTIQRFIAWRKTHHLHPSRHATYNIFHTDPLTTPASEGRLDVCVATGATYHDEVQDIKVGQIAGGRCAVLRLVGNSHDLEPGFTFLYRTWLPDSGEEMRDFPPFCERVSFFPDVPEAQAITDLYLPLK
jgi:AraC family transcriptional regulator